MSRHKRITERQTDRFLKSLFSRRMVLAVLLKSFVPAFKEMAAGEIACHHLMPEGDSERIQIENTDDGDYAQFDLLFRVRVPTADGDAQIVQFNLEFQNKIHPGYYITKRGIYYGCRLLSEEKGRLFEDSHYDQMKKVFSLWLCPSAPRKLANSSVGYELVERFHFGSRKCLSNDRKVYDLLELMIIYLNDAEPPPKGTTGLGLLHTLLTNSLSSKERSEILKRDYNIEIDMEELEMFDMFKYAEENGIKKGRKEGRKKGRMEGRDEERKKIISNMLKNGKKTDEICKDLGLTLMQFNEYTTEAVL